VEQLLVLRSGLGKIEVIIHGSGWFNGKANITAMFAFLILDNYEMFPGIVGNNDYIIALVYTLLCS
jgi:hypothetical protein